MLEGLWKLLRAHGNLIDEGRAQSIEMLKTSHHMFATVIRSLPTELAGAKNQVAPIDKKINRAQREVRRMVYEHLTLSSGRDILEGLRLTTIVIDIERIGDLAKNIEELFAMLPQGFDPKTRLAAYPEIEQLALDIFGDCEQALNHDDSVAAQRVIDKYEQVAKLCEKHLRDILQGEADDDKVPRSDIAVVVLLRYIKRASGHLKNIASALLNPYDRIGFKNTLS